MFLTIVILIACAVVAIAGAPLLAKVVPPNAYYGVPTRRMNEKPDVWIRVNQVAGGALVGAAFFTALLLMFYNGTWLRSGWAQILLFIFALVAAVAGTLWYARNDIQIGD